MFGFECRGIKTFIFSNICTKLATFVKRRKGKKASAFASCSYHKKTQTKAEKDLKKKAALKQY